MRADARRNHDAVLEAGARLLAERPTASMQEIADASGVGRTTVYRHFPAREDLVSALVERVAEEVTAATHAALASDESVEHVLRQLAARIVAVGRRWRFLEQQEHVRASIGESDRAFRDWIAAAQVRGELRDDLSPDWVLAMSRGMFTEAIEEASGELGPDRAGELLGETLVILLVPRR